MTLLDYNIQLRFISTTYDRHYTCTVAVRSHHPLGRSQGSASVQTFAPK